MTALYAKVTAGIHDMNGFADLGKISVEQYEAAETFGWPDGEEVTYILDLYEGEHSIIDDKTVSRETAAALIGADLATIDQKARQMLAEINDEYAAYVASRARIQEG